VNGWGRSAIYRQAVPRSQACRARCSASYQAIPQASGRSRFPRRTGSKALATALPCSVPADAGKTDGGDCDKPPRQAGGLPLPCAQSGKRRPAEPRRQFPKHPSPLQITHVAVTHDGSAVYNIVILFPQWVGGASIVACRIRARGTRQLGTFFLRYDSVSQIGLRVTADCRPGE